MAYTTQSAGTLVFKARRDTVLLVVGACAATFALASAIHTRPASDNPALPQAQTHWTGDLADLSALATGPADGAPITSASLVVPAADFALPPMHVRELVKLRACDTGLCAPRTVAPAKHPPAPMRTAVRRGTSHRARPSLLSQLNPLNHLPGMDVIGRPFAVAGDTVSGWLKRF